MQLDEATIAWYWPATQLVQLVEPPKEYSPVPQVRQLVAPVALLYAPALHGVHILAPVAAEYVPAMQVAHDEAADAPVAGCDFPAAQPLHVVDAWAPVDVE